MCFSPLQSSSIRTSISTSDSDVSPHTSTVVDNCVLQNGWGNSDITLKIPPGNPRASSGGWGCVYFICMCVCACVRVCVCVCVREGEMHVYLKHY